MKNKSKAESYVAHKNIHPWMMNESERKEKKKRIRKQTKARQQLQQVE